MKMQKGIPPGEFIAYSEEYSPLAGTSEEEGKIYSAQFGLLEKDDGKRTVQVIAKKTTRPLRKGDLVYARVEDVYDQVSLLKFQPVESRMEIIGTPNSMAYLRISEVQKGYTERFRDFLRIGDFILARVTEVSNLGIYLTMSDPSLGVVRAFCGKCKEEMQLTQGEFYCSFDNIKERRKIVENAYEGGNDGSNKGR